MNKKYKVVTLCGSSSFKDDFIKIQRILTLQGCIVISLGLFAHADNEYITNELREKLIDMHKERIRMADSIFVINKYGYIGENTAAEIEFAKSIGKSIEYMVDPLE